MITLSGSRVFFSPSPPFPSASSLFFPLLSPFSRTVEGNHCRMLKRICIFACCCHAPHPPLTRPGSARFFVLFVVNFLVVVLSVACNLFVYFWRRLHQIRQCRQAESLLSPSFSSVPFVMLVFCVCQFYASSSKLCVQMAFT